MSKVSLKFAITFLLIVAFEFTSVAQKISLERVEPPFWWAGMKSPDLQLMVYGNSIASATPVIEYAGVSISKTSVIENHNYLFIDLIISADAQSGSFPIVFKKGKKKVAEYTYELKNRKPGSALRTGFDQSDVIYLLFPDRFANGDLDNDSGDETLEKADRSNPTGRHGGDIKGISDNLDYLDDMGFTAVWFNPLLENNMPAYSYHGYAITDFYKVDPRFGTNNDYKNLVAQMHAKDMKVIMDMIFNHCGDQHWWIKDLPSQDWIHQFPEFTRSNFRGGSVFDPYASDTDRERFHKGWFDTTMPDLNQNNEFLLTYLIQNSIWWIEYADLDGIRMDTYPYPYPEGMAEWGKRILEEYPDFPMVGEVWLPQPGQIAAWQDGDKVETGYQSNLPYVFDFAMYDAFRHAFTEDPGWSNGIIRMYDILSQDYMYSNPLDIVTFADNHDGDRIYTKLGEDLDRFKMAMAFLMTTRGIPQVYYGTEVLMTGLEHDGHGEIRKDLPGGWPGDTANTFTRKNLSTEQLKAIKFMDRLLNWRKDKEVIHYGKLKHFIPVDGLYTYFRYNDTDRVMVLINTSDKEITFDPEYYNEMLAGYQVGKNILTGKSHFLTKIKLKPHTPMVLELR